jgi:plastocyanin
MRKLPLGIVALAVFAVAPTFGATKGVEVTHAGFTPSKVTVDYGDTVTWTNRDTTSHQVVSDRGEFPASPVLDPNQTYTYTFMKSGSFGYRDAFNVKKRGTVVVRTGVSITAAPALAVYGSSPTLSGLVSSGASGESVTIDGMQCGSTMFARVASVSSTAEGRWRSSVKPVVNTVYQATWKNAKSAQLTQKVAPQFSFRRVRALRFAVSVAAAQGFVGKFVVLQRYRAGKHMWKTVKRVRLNTAKPGVAPTVISSARFGAPVPRRTRLRLLFAQDQVGTCYAATRSAVVRG